MVNSIFKRLLDIAVCVGLLAVAVPASAQFSAISSPAADYTGKTTKIAITGTDNTSVINSVTDGSMTISLSTPLTVHTVPGGGWSTWGSPPDTESSTPRVIGIYSVLTSETLTLSTPAYTFGVELEPDTFSTFSVSVAFMNGSTTVGTVTRSVNGSAGARLFAASSSTPFTSVVITAPSGANGFALANFRYSTAQPSAASIPTLSEWGIILTACLLALCALMVKRKRQM